MQLDFKTEEVNFILSVLGKMPMEQVEPLVNNIRKQAFSQQNKNEDENNSKDKLAE